MNTTKLYQDIYDQNKWYGDSASGRCPAVRLLPKYASLITGKVLDLGCGRGDSVIEMRKMGIDADGIDQIDLKNGMKVGSIIDDLDMQGYDTALSIDVIEHIPHEDCRKLFENMLKCKNQIFSIHNAKSTMGDGIELHINRKSWSDWKAELEQYFDILEIVEIESYQMLYHTKQKTVNPC